MNDIQEFVQLLRTVPRDWRAVIDRRLAPLGLSQAKWMPLLYLMRADGPPTQTEIAKHLEIESPTLVRLLDRLAADGWIERKACPGDRRARHIHLTPRAKSVCVEIQTIVMDVRQQLLKDVSQAELSRCIGLLRRINQASQAMASSEDGQLPAALAAPMPTAPKPPRKRSDA
ncbi:MarR family transcriptional regulator [Nevskia sp.]|uniref:MarR family winged helix-turn-helix transcriptional regulator n=1 Tax=Nevskia sp. TaxID=1929292 RepID=UPI0025F85B12|nr:MarR family transcriptional regulator [Nevskia sp.]